MSEDIKDMAQARRVITQLRGLVAERDAMLGKRPCQNSRCNELNAARALLLEVAKSIQECDTGGVFDQEKMRIRSYLDACDTLEGNKPIDATGCRKCGDILSAGHYCKAPTCPLNPSMKGKL